MPRGEQIFLPSWWKREKWSCRSAYRRKQVGSNEIYSATQPLLLLRQPPRKPKGQVGTARNSSLPQESAFVSRSSVEVGSATFRTAKQLSIYSQGVLFVGFFKGKQGGSCLSYRERGKEASGSILLQLAQCHTSRWQLKCSLRNHPPFTDVFWNPFTWQMSPNQLLLWNSDWAQGRSKQLEMLHHGHLKWNTAWDTEQREE